MAVNKKNGLNSEFTSYDNVFDEIKLEELQDIQNTTNSSDKSIFQSKKAVVLFIYIGLELVASLVPALNSSINDIRPLIMLYLSTQAGIDVTSILKK